MGLWHMIKFDCEPRIVFKECTSWRIWFVSWVLYMTWFIKSQSKSGILSTIPTDEVQSNAHILILFSTPTTIFAGDFGSKMTKKNKKVIQGYTFYEQWHDNSLHGMTGCIYYGSHDSVVCWPQYLLFLVHFIWFWSQTVGVSWQNCLYIIN